MLRCLAFLLALAAPTWAQFAELATTDDGQQLYFSSPLNLRDATAPTRAESRIFRLAPDGIRLFAERGLLALTESGSNVDGMGMPQVSGDGQTIGYTARNICLTGSTCTPVSAMAVLRGRLDISLGEGYLQLSRNGRWALLSPGPAFLGSGPGTLVDLDTGERTTLPPPATESFALASNGAVLVLQAGALGLWRQGQFSPISLTGPVRPLAVSDNAATLIYAQVAGGIRLLARDLASGRETTLFQPAQPTQFPQLQGLSNDGRWVLYTVGEGQLAGPAFVADAWTGQSQSLPLPQGELAAAGTLGGFGDFAFLATTAGRIVKIALTNGAPSGSETVVPSTPYVAQLLELPVGSLVRFQGSLPASAKDLTGRILLDNQPLPVLFATPSVVGVQIPWEQRTGDIPFRLDLPSASPFRQNQLASVTPIAPAFEPLGPGESSILGIKLIRSDFSGLLDTQPAAGDIVHAYLTGLGPARGHPGTGVPVPVGSIIPIDSDLRCRFTPQQTDAETLFAGLAPGLIGIYQVSFRMPADAGTVPLTGMNCQLGGPSGGASFGFGRLATRSSPAR